MKIVTSGLLKRRDLLGAGLSVAVGCALAAAEGNAIPTRSGRLAVPGGSIQWRSIGSGPRPPLLLVHGGPSPAGSIGLDRLAGLAKERQVFTWDQLDCGESDKPRDPRNWRLARFVEEMEQVRNHLAPGPVHVMGGSWGSTLTMEWLVTRQPANVASVIFMCPTLDQRAETSRRAAQQRLSPAAREAFARASLEPPGEALRLAQQEYTRTYILRHPAADLPYDVPDGDILRVLFADLRPEGRVAELATLRKPVLFVRGEHDYVTDEDVRGYAMNCSDADVATIPDAAHLAFIDNPTATVAAIRRFLSRVEPAVRNSP